MRFGQTRLCVLLAWITVATLPAVSQVVGNTRSRLYISGYIRNEQNNEAIKGATVELQRESGEKASPAVQSGLDGEFEFDNVTSGNYQIAVEQRGYVSAHTNIMLAGTPLTKVLITLRKPASDKRPSQGDLISAHQLTVPDKAREAYEKGMKILRGDDPDFERALALFQKAIELFPRYYEAYAETGVAYHHLKRLPEAEHALRRSVELSASQYPEALYLLSEMLDDQERFAEAESFARRRGVRDDHSWRGHLMLARALAGLKRANDAELSALRATQLAPENAQGFLVLGNIHIQQHKYAAVIQDFDTYLRLDPMGPESEAVRHAEEQARVALQRSKAEVPAAPKQ